MPLAPRRRGASLGEDLLVEDEVHGVAEERDRPQESREKARSRCGPPRSRAGSAVLDAVRRRLPTHFQRGIPPAIARPRAAASRSRRRRRPASIGATIWATSAGSYWLSAWTIDDVGAVERGPRVTGLLVRAVAAVGRMAEHVEAFAQRDLGGLVGAGVVDQQARSAAWAGSSGDDVGIVCGAPCRPAARRAPSAPAAVAHERLGGL